MSSARCIHPRKREYHVQGSQICQGSKRLRTSCSCSPPCSTWPSPSHILSDMLGTGLIHVRPQVCEEIRIQIWMRLLQHSFQMFSSYSDNYSIFKSLVQTQALQKAKFCSAVLLVVETPTGPAFCQLYWFRFGFHFGVLEAFGGSAAHGGA